MTMSHVHSLRNSASRRAMLDAAGVPHEARGGAGRRGRRRKESLIAGGVCAARLADALAELKALKVLARGTGRRWCSAASRWWRSRTGRCSTSR